MSSGVRDSDRPRVFVAEDDGPMRDLLAAALAAAGFSVTTAADGRELLDRLADADDGELPDVVVTDLRMRNCGGFGVLAEVREHYPGLPVVLITAFGEPSVHERAYQLGAAQVFDKPVPLDVLRATIADLADGGR